EAPPHAEAFAEIDAERVAARLVGLREIGAELLRADAVPDGRGLGLVPRIAQRAVGRRAHAHAARALPCDGGAPARLLVVDAVAGVEREAQALAEPLPETPADRDALHAIDGDEVGNRARRERGGARAL